MILEKVRLESRVQGRCVEVAFDGGVLSSDGGLVLLEQAERETGKVRQSLRSMLMQRVYGICCGYEDCNDFNALSSDPLFKLSCGRLPLSGQDLSSQPTLSRFENSVTRKDLYRLSEALVAVFVARHKKSPPLRIVIDADATDDPAYGQQEFEFYHGYYNRHCFLPLLVHASADTGEQELIAAVLRPGNVHAGAKAVFVLRRLLSRLKEAFPQTEVVFRGDAGFALPAVYTFLESEKVPYAISLPKNARLLKEAEPLRQMALLRHEETKQKVRLFGEISYAAATWPSARRVVVKAEVMEKGENPRFVVTTLLDAPQELYAFYTQRGDVENRIKELKNDLFSGRTSCHRFLANQFRLLLHAAAFVLVQAVRRNLHGTMWEAAQASTLRVRLFKVAARVVQTTRRIVLHLPTGYPLQETWTSLLYSPDG